MKYLFAVPVVATLLLGGFAMAETVATSPESAPTIVGADGPTDQSGPDKDKWHEHHHHFGHFMRGPSPLADLPKPMTADSVKQALDAWFARRPQVKSVTEKDPNVLVVEIVDPEGKTHRFELNRTTGERRPAW